LNETRLYDEKSPKADNHPRFAEPSTTAEELCTSPLIE